MVPACPTTYSRALTASPSGRTLARAGRRRITASRYWPRISTPIRAGSRSRRGRSQAGLKACWSTPIKATDGRVIGTFAFYFRESRAPSRWHQRIVDACVHLGALAIERKEARAQIARLAYHDMLTGLPNRAQLRELINQAIADLSRAQNRSPWCFSTSIISRTSTIRWDMRSATPC